MCLLLLVLLSLLGACIRSSRVSGGRVQAVNAMDTAMYSLFAQYDRDLLKDYHLFFLDGGYGENALNLSQLLTQTEAFAQPVLSSGLSSCHLEACGINGFRLATDNNGAAVQAQIIRYMKDNLGSKGIEFIKKQINQNKAVMEEQEKIQEGVFLDWCCRRETVCQRNPWTGSLFFLKEKPPWEWVNWLFQQKNLLQQISC